MNNAWRWYVYELIDPRSGTVFYVGKGTGNRMHQHEKDAARRVCSKKTRLIKELLDANLEVQKRQVAFFCDEQEAYDAETDWIESIGLENLTNVLPGGQKAWVERVRKRAKRAEVKRAKADDSPNWLDLLGRIAWVVKVSDGLKNEFSLTHSGPFADMRNSISAAVEKHYGGNVAMAKEVLRLAVQALGFDAVSKELLTYNIQLERGDGCA